MPKKTTKTAHVMSILTKNGVAESTADDLAQEVGVESNNVSISFEDDNSNTDVSKAVENGLLELLEQEETSKISSLKNSSNTEFENQPDKGDDSIGTSFAKTPNTDIVKKYGDEYIVTPPISKKPSYSAPPTSSENFDYPENSEVPKHFNMLQNVKEYAPEIFFDPDEKDQFPESYFTEKEKQTMSNYDATKLPLENEEYVCINVVEEITAAMLTDVMHRFELCTCEKCKADVMAIALNDLTPKYVGTYKGQLFVKLAGYEKQYSADVLSSLTKACIHVKSNPRHDAKK